MSRTPYHTVGISLILLVDETQNEKADGRQRTNLNTVGLAGRPLATHREYAIYRIASMGSSYAWSVSTGSFSRIPTWVKTFR